MQPRPPTAFKVRSPRFLSHNDLRLLVALLSCLSVIACSPSIRDEPPAPAKSYEQFAPVDANENVRFYGDLTEFSTSEIVEQFRTAVASHQNAGPVNILAISGGGPNGAFGAGVLNGWTESGKRPQFDVVTGISTGAILAPFAFLGSEYDAAIARFYTSTETRDVARFRVLQALFTGRSLAKNHPLATSIERELTDEMIARIALEHGNGRRLFIGTTNMDAERPVIWDIGAIASLNTPASRNLIRQVILASASIPLVFEPVAIKVTNGSTVRSEVHVDGAVTQQIFAYPAGLDLRAILKRLGLSQRRNTLWLLHNARLEPKFVETPTRLRPLAERTYQLVTRTLGLGDFAYIISLAHRDGLLVRGMALPTTFDASPSQFFDPAYMSELYLEGRRLGQNTQSWRDDLEQVFLGRD